MKVRVKHNDTEVEIIDAEIDSPHSLIYHNQPYLLSLLEKIADEIVKINEGKLK